MLSISISEKLRLPYSIEQPTLAHEAQKQRGGLIWRGFPPQLPIFIFDCYNLFILD